MRWYMNKIICKLTKQIMILIFSYRMKIIKVKVDGKKLVWEGNLFSQNWIKKWREPKRIQMIQLF